MAITRTPIIDDDGSGTTGTVIDNAWKQEFYNQIDAIVGGAWIQVPFNAANFYASAEGTWTVTAANQNNYAYVTVGPVRLVAIYLSNTGVAGNPVSLNVKFSDNWGPTHMIGQTYPYANNAIATSGFVTNEGAVMKFHRDTLGTPWAAGGVHFSAMLLWY